jgi:monovalent cation:H+ antiporter-2, CPA2 family
VDSPNLLVTLAAAVGVAAVCGLVAVKLGQSTMLGFILGGIVIGPYTPGLVADVASVRALADVGIIFLLFAVGVQLSLRDLLRSGRAALLGATAQVLLTIGVGYLAGLALGWRPVEALFLGAVLSNSSSTVIGKVLGERGELDAEHGQLAMAWSTVQDLSTIVLVVVLGAAAGPSEQLLGDLFWATARALAFLALLVPLGVRVLPRIFEWVAAFRSREVFVLAIAAVALGTAYLSSLFGVSVALGAFVGGIAVGESDLSHQILDEILPLRDVLAALFFVSVGMLVDPLFVLAYAPLVLLALVLIVLVKGAMAAGLARLLGYSPRTALLAGAALAQSAEFSFLLASLGSELGVVSATAFNVMLVGSAGSIVLAPHAYRWASRGATVLERKAGMAEVARTAAEPAAAQRRHAVVLGYGRVGGVVARALRRRGFEVVVIDQDPRVVRALRAAGVTAYTGSADNTILLDRVGLDRARLLVLAVPDAVVARSVVEYARRVNPSLDIVARTHDEAEMRELLRRDVDEAVMGELELALEMTRHALRRFGVSGAGRRRRRRAARYGAGGAPRGMVNENVDPVPGADSTAISPPWASTSSRLTYSPSPSPWVFRAVPSAR